MPLLPPTTKRFHQPSSSHQSYLNNTTFESLTVNFESETRVSFSSISNDDIIHNLNELNRHPIVKILSSHRYAYGINILIKSGIYLAAYPPHEPFRTEEKNKDDMNTRELLWLSWAQIKHVRNSNCILYSNFRSSKYNPSNSFERISEKMSHCISSFWAGTATC